VSAAQRRTRPSEGLRVVLEVGTRRTFASAVEWPGWSRSGRDPEAALETLALYAPRYAVATRAAGVRFPVTAAETFEIVERLPGTATTDFGAPGVIADDDYRPCAARETSRLAALVAASWAVLEQVATTAPAELRKGPRGGGRDRDAIVGHVIRAEAAYVRKIGLRMRESDADDPQAVEAMRAGILDVIKASRTAPSRTDKSWPARYAARRIAWHVLDHAWEIEDRSETG